MDAGSLSFPSKLGRTLGSGMLPRIQAQLGIGSALQHLLRGFLLRGKASFLFSPSSLASDQCAQGGFVLGCRLWLASLPLEC